MIHWSALDLGRAAAKDYGHIHAPLNTHIRTYSIRGETKLEPYPTSAPGCNLRVPGVFWLI